MSKLLNWSMLSLVTLCWSVPAVGLFAQEEPIAVASPTNEAASPKDVPATEADKPQGEVKGELNDKRVRPLTVSVQLLRSDLVITGALTDSTMLQLKTAFGEASIPLSEVAGVRFPSGQDTSTTLVMLNGDSITGASDVKSLTVETEWGSAKISGESISAMQFVPGLEWQSVTGLNGARWSLVEAKAKPAGSAVFPSAAGSTSGTVSGGLNGASIPGLPQQGSQAPRVVFPR